MLHASCPSTAIRSGGPLSQRGTPRPSWFVIRDCALTTYRADCTLARTVVDGGRCYKRVYIRFEWIDRIVVQPMRHHEEWKPKRTQSCMCIIEREAEAQERERATAPLSTSIWLPSAPIAHIDIGWIWEAVGRHARVITDSTRSASIGGG
ncbi:hypothetical protein SCP_0102410 [Sparassis crispa]|uniref:Uncharacterized protein n=1 Tax=Sparassis crispa TaxID=139825 RepID=A0A401G5D0_9APHY|nr:hypothetical protein SCP_0102410 [Sparassis crispa]GBE77368.1 hypothetical protein SCP_0102410 [Sparassis crispa]